MPVSPSTVLRRALLQINQYLPDRPVRRNVRGIDMLLPRRHGLPYFARPGTPYAQNLVDLAAAIAAHGDGTINLLDVGGNVGDSTLLVLDQVPGVAVCVEANPRWQTYLQSNLGDREGVAIVNAVLVEPGTDTDQPLAMRSADIGSSIVVREDDPEAVSSPAITTDELRRRAPQLDAVNLIKSDTDGYDVMLVQGYVASFADAIPVLFFEYDPRPTRMVTPEYVPQELWEKLVTAGYQAAAVWDNRGNFLFRADTSDLTELSAVLEDADAERGYAFWDVAVAHKDDAVGLAALAEVSR